MKPIPAGALDRRVTVERPLVTRDADTGAPLTAWPALGTFFAQVLESAPAADEEQRVGVLTYSRPTRVRLRYRADIDSTMRVRLDVTSGAANATGVPECVKTFIKALVTVMVHDPALQATEAASPLLRGLLDPVRTYA